nr:uncharacterized protein LOC124818292 [Hydra vulgaris]
MSRESSFTEVKKKSSIGIEYRYKYRKRIGNNIPDVPDYYPDHCHRDDFGIVEHVVASAVPYLTHDGLSECQQQLRGRSLKSNSCYISTIINSFDIIFLSEHRLSNVERFILYDLSAPTHQIFFHSAEKKEYGRPFGGNAFLVCKNLLLSLHVIHEDEHILAIKGSYGNSVFIFIGVYLTSCRNTSESLKQYLSQLSVIASIINTYEDEEECITAGDFQLFPENIYDTEVRNNQTRNNFSRHLSNFLETNELSFLDIISGTGPTYTYKHKTLNNSSYIDHIAYAWKDDNFIEIYNRNLSQFFEDYAFIGEAIEKQTQTTCEKINNAAALAMKECYQKKEFCIYSKSWWTPEVKLCKDILSFHFKEWKKCNYCRSQESISFNKYKLARKNFRKTFWNNIRKIKSIPNTRILTINKKQVGKEIVEEFRQNFNTIFNTPTITNNNSEHRNIPQLIVEPNKILLSTSDIESCIRKLKSNRSRDSCGITAEHLKYSSNNNLVTWLSKFYNSIFNNGAVPEYLSTSIITPIVKSYKKSLNNSDNYRGISITPTLTKLFEYIIMQVCPEISDIHSHQFGFKQNSSTLHAEFLLSETLKHYNNNKSPVYICSLDANKAFDSCNWDLLFEKLYYNKNLPLSVVRALQSLYRSGTANISYLGHKSNNFCLTQGVRQGSILSPHLYNIYTESILSQIVSDCKVGTTVIESVYQITEQSDLSFLDFNSNI